MSAFGVLRKVEGGCVTFWCPGCKGAHVIQVEGPHAWGFNGDGDKPTFAPSVLVTSGHYAEGWKGPGCWCTFTTLFPQYPPNPYKCGICHSFVTDGNIQFLADSTHELAGKTVALEPF